MNFGLAYNATIKKFSLRVSELSRRAEIHRSVIARFRSGTQAINTDSMEKLVAALDNEAFAYWVSQLLSARELQQKAGSSVDLSEVVDHLSDQEVANLLLALAAKLKNESRER